MRSEGGPLGLLVLVASGFVALCCAVIVLAGKPAPDEPDDAPPAAKVEEARVEPTPAPSEPVREQPAEPPPAPQPPEPAPQPQDPYVEPVGHLHVYSTPVARVFVDGVDTGMSTPIRGDNLPLRPGKHKVMFVLGDDKYTFAVRIKAGQTESISKSFAAANPP